MAEVNVSVEDHKLYILLFKVTQIMASGKDRVQRPVRRVQEFQLLNVTLAMLLRFSVLYLVTSRHIPKTLATNFPHKIFLTAIYCNFIYL